MKIGNLSQNIITVPEFFQKPTQSNYDYSFIYPPIKNYQKKMFKETDYLTFPLLTNLNFSRNYKKPPVKLNKCEFYEPIPDYIKDKKIFKPKKFDELENNFMSKTFLDRLSYNEMNKTMKSNFGKINNNLNERNELYIDTINYQDNEQIFRNTIKDKINSLNLISQRVKTEITYRNSNIRGRDSFNKFIHPKKDMKNTFFYFGTLPNISNN